MSTEKWGSLDANTRRAGNLGPRRLGFGVLDSLSPASKPLIDARDLRTGIVHLGPGAFFRAHQAVYTEEAIAAAGGDWGITVVAPHSTGVADTLRAQDGLFSVTTLSPGAAGHSSPTSPPSSLSRSSASSTSVPSSSGADSGGSGLTRVVGSLTGVLHAPSAGDEVVALLASPGVRVVTLTITEKGYAPTAAMPVLLVRALEARRRADAGPITLLSCDNLPSNGRWLRGVIETLSEQVPGLREWVAASVGFPGSMVDRIVPATTPDTLATAAAALGADDLAAVAGEPYRQWVIEDDFPGGRPAWEQAGVVLTGDAQPWERLKLRTLNGVHSALAYLGALAGCETIAEALELPGMRTLLKRLIADDIAPTLAPPDGVTVPAYGASVLERFANPAVVYRTVQVAMDGSQKLPQRILHTIGDRRAAGADPHWALLAVAAWMRFVQGRTDDGRDLPLNDPLADRIRAQLAGASPGPEGITDALLRIHEIFPPSLAEDATVRTGITKWLTFLDKHGAAATVAGAQ
ncbi:mannitol dehydrogenase family protein [Symbioplanes lichenis]|uniref:mannitol dehydrogenase family protein n=1 Tax=Symbioplanes lichenis TaxID=1629072 RepID=UPI0027399253|nr:mannitol dehydrogenase family protein [Actinoplanes lichenis]